MIKALLITLLTATLAHAQGYDARTADYLRAWRIGAAGGELWTPAELGDDLTLWLDAADNSTLWADTSATTAATNGSAVARWDDKSGNNRNATQNTPANRPIVQSAELNSKSVLRFDGSNDTLSSTYSFAIHNISAFMVFRSRDSSLQYASAQRPTTNGRFYFTSGTAVKGAGILSFGESTNWQTMFIAGTTSQLIASRNGASLQTESDSRQATAPTVWIGGGVVAAGGTTPGIYGQVDVSEYLFVAGLISTNDRQRVEGYLAHKWGLTANLPSDHPYKNNPPMK